MLSIWRKKPITRAITAGLRTAETGDCCQPGRPGREKPTSDTFEQLGYQAESATWRGFYLTGAKELREGVNKFDHASTASPDTIEGMTVEMLFDLWLFVSTVRKPRVNTSA